MYRFRNWGFLLLTMLPAVAESETHEKVQAALAWEVPVNTCKKPRMIAVASKVAAAEGDISQVDVDTYTIKRYERKEKRWQSCVDKYKKPLLDDMEKLKGSAQYGLTKDQAEVILGKMAQLQAVYVSPEGRVDAP